MNMNWILTVEIDVGTFNVYANNLTNARAAFAVFEDAPMSRKVQLHEQILDKKGRQTGELKLIKEITK